MGELWQISNTGLISKAHSELCQTSKIEIFVEIVNGFGSLTIFAKSFGIRLCISKVLYNCACTSVLISRARIIKPVKNGRLTEMRKFSAQAEGLSDLSQVLIM